MLLFIFTKNILLLLYFIYSFFIKIIFIFHVPGCSDMFRNVPACSGMFRVPGFIDARFKIVKLTQFQLFTPLFD